MVADGTILAFPTDSLLNPEPQQGGKTMGLGILAIGLVSSLLFAGSFFLPRKPWAWNVHMVLIVLGIVGVVSTPCALIMAVFWFRQDTMAWFGQKLEPKPDLENEDEA